MVRRIDRLRFKVKRLLGMDLRLATEDRRVLENIIFPYLVSREDFRRVLFVGCDWYTASYVKVFSSRNFIGRSKLTEQLQSEITLTSAGFCLKFPLQPFLYCLEGRRSGNTANKRSKILAFLLLSRQLTWRIQSVNSKKHSFWSGQTFSGGQGQ
jgi:hypothetical protein